MWTMTSHRWSGRPASSSRTRLAGSALSRLASTEPADPDPTTTKSTTRSPLRAPPLEPVIERRSSPCDRSYCGGTQQLAEIRPAARTPVARADVSDVHGPADTELGVVIAHAVIGGGVVLPIDPVADVGHVGERLEAVQEPGRNVHVHHVPVIEPQRNPPSEGRRLRPRV